MILALVIGCARTVSEPPTVRGEGLRVTIGAEDVRLEVPIRRLARDDGPAVVLAGAVHVADPGFYDQLGKILASCPSGLLEGLTPDPDAPQPDVDLGPLLASRGLVRQGEALADPDGWRTVDLSVAEVRAALSIAGAPPELIAAWLDDRDQSAMRALLEGSSGRELVRLTVLGGIASPSPTEEWYWDVVIGLRNQAVVDAVEGPGPIGLLYGADHLADLEARLVRRGWRRVSETWLAAITVPYGELGLGPVQVRQRLGRR